MAKPPAFQFYATDFLADGPVMEMTYEERGVYATLLAVAWNEGGLPLESDRIRRLLKLGDDDFARVWPAVARCWRERKDRLVNPRMEKERRNQADYRRKQSGRATTGWQTRRNAAAVPGDAGALPSAAMPHDCSPSPVSVSGLQSPSPQLPDPDPPLLASLGEPPQGGPTNGSGTKATKSRTRRIRARLPDEWAPSDEAVAQAKGLGFSESELEAITDEFCTHWWGEGKAKADWDMTWLNRVIALKHGGRKR